MTIALTPMTFDQLLLVESYREAYKSSISSVNGSCEKIVTASFSLVTAYGALLALVTPKDEVAGWVIGAPILILALASLAALIGHSLGLSGAPTNVIADVSSAVTNTIDHKRQWALVGLSLLAVAIALGGWVTYQRYGSPTPDSTESTVQLSTEGTDRLATLCAADLEVLTASKVEIGLEVVSIEGAEECGGADVVLALGDIEAVVSG